MTGERLSAEALDKRLPPMLFGWIRWDRGLGRPKGTAGDGFHVTIRERLATTYVDRGHGIYDPTPGGWAGPDVTVPCFDVPDEEQMHVVGFRAPDVHLTAALDGYYHVRVSLTDSWRRDGLFGKLWGGYFEVSPAFCNVLVWPSQPFCSVEFLVQHRPFLLAR